MRVGQCMTQTPVTATPEMSLIEAALLLRSHRMSHLPIVEGGSLVGVVSDRDIRRATPSLLLGVEQAAYDKVMEGTPVSKVMTREPFTVTSDTPVADAVEILLDKRIGGLPVVDGVQLVGIFTQRDALRLLQQLLGASA